jgi:hypothetical protein
MLPPRGIRVRFQPGWGVPGEKGLLGPDPRLCTLRKVLVSYPEVRHILPDRISFESAADPRLLETVAKFLERQHWLVRSVEVE